MSGVELEPTSTGKASQGTTLEWTVRLWKREPTRLLAIAAVACLAGVIGLLALKSLIGGVIGVLMIVLSTADFTMPIRFRLDGTGASRRVGFSVTSIPWDTVRSVRFDDIGAKLSPLEDPSSRMEAFRGVYLVFEGNQEDVLEVIRRHVGEACKISGPKN